MENLVADNPVGAAADNPSEPGALQNGTGSPGGQAPGATPADDLFKGVDPNRLPPEVKAHYDSMLRDYRDKTAKLSETVKSESAKAAEAFKTKAEMYDQIATQEEFVRQWNEYVQKSQSTSQPAQEGDPVLLQMKAQIQEMNQKLQFSEMNQIAEAFIEAVDDKGQKLHPEFDALNGIVIGSLQGAQGPEEFSLLRACIELSPGKSPQEKLANGYKMAKANYDAIFEAGRKAGMGRMQIKALNGSQLPSHSGHDLLSITDKKPKNAREAMEMAKRGQVVSRS